MKQIKLFDQSTDNKELVAVKKTLESHFWASGSSSGNVGKFEQSLKNYMGTTRRLIIILYDRTGRWP